MNGSQILLIDHFALGSLLTFSLMLVSLYYWQKKTEYLYLTGYFIAQSLILLVSLGIDIHYISSLSVVVKGGELPFLQLITVLCILVFCQQFYPLSKRLNKVFNITKYILFIGLFLYIFLPIAFIALMSHFSHLALISVFLVVNVHLFKLQHHTVKLFSVIVCFFILIYGFSFIQMNDSEFPLDLMALTYWPTGCLLIILLIREASNKVTAQRLSEQKALTLAAKSQQAYEELLTLQEENQELLEVRVQERTFELNIALQELEEANKELEQKNTLDELTGLYNRRFYDQKLLAEFRRSRRNLTPLSLLVIDIDHFKNVNDSYGHSAGDKCLMALGKLIQQVLRRSSDIGCRYGGEEFCLILPETDNQGATALAEELRELVMNEQIHFESRPINLTISCGICTYQQQKGVEPLNIFDGADKALYQAKTSGRNQVQSAEISVVLATQL